MKNSTDKQGFIIVFTLVLMAVLLSTALGFSYVILADINKAKAIDNSIIAYYAADAGLEQSLYLLRKQELTQSVDDLKSRGSGIGSGGLAISNGQWNINDSTDYESSVLRQRLSNGQSVKFFLLNRATSNNSKSISVVWHKGDGTAPKLSVKLTQLSPQNQSGNWIYYTDLSQIEIADSSSNPKGQTCYSLNDKNIDGSPITPAPDYLAELTVMGASPGDYIDQININAYNNLDCAVDPKSGLDINPQGITNLTLKSTGVYGRSTQNIVAHILPRDPLSGLLGFVLFSEQDVVKE